MSNMTEQKERTIGPYLLVRLLGEGGQGKVYQGFDPILQRYVAIKLLSAGYAPSESIIHEARVIAKLDHPNIIRIHHINQLDDGLGWYLSMEYISGGSLEQYLNQKGNTLDIKEIIQIAIQVAGALDCAHQHGIIHRDVKPGNLLLSKEGVLKVSDFGLASSMDRISHHDRQIGTPYYMAPEIWQCQKAVAETDIYALGACLYQLLVGQPMFSVRNAEHMAQLHINKIPQNPRELNPVIPVELADVVMRCLEKAPEKRFRTASSLQKELLAMSSEPGATFPAGISSEDFEAVPSQQQVGYLEWFGLRVPPCQLTIKGVSNAPSLQIALNLTWHAFSDHTPLVLLQGPAGTGREFILHWLLQRGEIRSQLRIAHRISIAPTTKHLLDAFSEILPTERTASLMRFESPQVIANALSSKEYHVRMTSYTHFKVYRVLQPKELLLLVDILKAIVECSEMKLIIETDMRIGDSLFQALKALYPSKNVYQVKVPKMSRQVFESYLQSEWFAAGGKVGPWISKDAITLLFHYSDGLLWNIKRILQNSFFVAWSLQKRILNSWIIHAGQEYQHCLFSIEQLDERHRHHPATWSEPSILSLLEKLKKQGDPE